MRKMKERYSRKADASIYDVEYRTMGYADMVWDFHNSIYYYGHHSEWVKCTLWGYNDANWWQNVITKPDANVRIVDGLHYLTNKPTGRKYKVVFDVKKCTAEVYLLNKADVERLKE